MRNREYYKKCADKGGLYQDFYAGIVGNLRTACMDNICRSVDMSK